MRFLSFFIVCLFFSTASFAEDLPLDMKRIIKTGEITVAMHIEDSPPFFMHDQKGNFYGFDVELAMEIARKLGVKLRFNRDAKTFDDVVWLVRQKKADIALSTISITLNRAISVRFTEPYITFHRTLLINRIELAKRKLKGEPPVILNNNGIKIGTIAGSSYVDFIKEDFPRAEVLLYSDWNNAVKDVLKGKIVALFYDETIAKNWNDSHPEGALYLQTYIMKDRPDHFACVTNWEDSHLNSWLNQFFRTIKNNGTYDRLFKKYIENEQWRRE